MKTLYLVRHAKSSWAMESQPDIDRPLNERGYGDAHSVSKHLHKEKCNPDLIISSPAIRAITTAMIFAGNLHCSKDSILIRQSLYETGREEYVECIQDFDDGYSSAMLFGHNPIISETAEYFLPKRNEDLPTCGVISIEFDVDLWEKVAKSAGRMGFYVSPSALKES